MLFASSFRVVSCVVVRSCRCCTNCPEREAPWAQSKSLSWSPHSKRSTGLEPRANGKAEYSLADIVVLRHHCASGRICLPAYGSPAIRRP